MVTVTDTNGCQDTLTVFVNSTIGVIELPSIDFNLYPNPNNGSFTVELSQKSDGTLEIFDVIGKLIYQESFNGTNTLIIDLGTVHSGSYMVRIVDGEYSSTKRVIIER